MPDTPKRDYLTIGEVLNLLKPDYADITISKIRFLESQGLIHPERTPSGYRKFRGDDIDRLSFILREQRDRFLPLRVIKTKLEARERGELDETPAESETGVRPEFGSPGFGASEVDLVPSGAELDDVDLVAASGLAADRIQSLIRYGLIESTPNGDDESYDECALIVAKIARGFAKYGIEARHLRMFAQSADREAALFEQVVAPFVAQSSPGARRQAIETLSDLAMLARKLHQVLLAQKLRER